MADLPTRPISGSPIPSGWFTTLWDAIQSISNISGDKKYIGVKKNANGFSIYWLGGEGGKGGVGGSGGGYNGQFTCKIVTDSGGEKHVEVVDGGDPDRERAGYASPASDGSRVEVPKATLELEYGTICLYGYYNEASEKYMYSIGYEDDAPSADYYGVIQLASVGIDSGGNYTLSQVWVNGSVYFENYYLC